VSEPGDRFPWFGVDVGRSSLLLPGRLRCLDPVATLRRAGALLAALTAFLYVLPSSVYVAGAAFVAGVCGSLLLSGTDRRRFSCTVLQVGSCRLLGFEERIDGVHGVLIAGGGRAAGLRSRMRLTSSQAVPPGMRRLPLALWRAGSEIRWQDGGNDVALDGRDEVLGALGVVSRGEDVRLEVVYGSRSGEGVRVVATRFSSSEGAVQSWEPGLLENPSYGLGVMGRVLPVLRGAPGA